MKQEKKVHSKWKQDHLKKIEGNNKMSREKQKVEGKFGQKNFGQEKPFSKGDSKPIDSGIGVHHVLPENFDDRPPHEKFQHRPGEGGRGLPPQQKEQGQNEKAGMMSKDNREGNMQNKY